MSDVQSVPLADITFESLIYPREIKESYNGEPWWYHVDRYHKAMEVGHKMPPIILAKIDGKNILIDGYHRKIAHERMKRTEIDAIFIQVKDWNEAFLQSVSRNTVHGVPLGKLEMVRAAGRLMRDNGFSAETVTYAVAMPQVDLDRQLSDRLYVDQSTGNQTYLKRPIVPVKQQLSEAFSESIQSPLNSEFQATLINQLNALFEGRVVDTASPAVRAGLNQLYKHMRNMMGRK